mmetsp:Transcript_16924/g.21932  ORF Transcript_16924/g.21932 Transcript_16924/m.21932 type:complete len:187 (+) Transcript_16924:43-603(+)
MLLRAARVTGRRCTGYTCTGHLSLSSSILRRQFSDQVSSVLGIKEASNVVASTDSARLQITGCDPGGFEIMGDLYIPSSIVALNYNAFLWRPQTIEDITFDSLGVFTIVHPRPEIVIIGLGANPSTRLDELFLYFRDEGIALEQMDTTNAVHTFNVLNDEERAVGAAILTMEPRGREGQDPYYFLK